MFSSREASHGFVCTMQVHDVVSFYYTTFKYSHAHACWKGLRSVGFQGACLVSGSRQYMTLNRLAQGMRPATLLCETLLVKCCLHLKLWMVQIPYRYIRNLVDTRHLCAITLSKNTLQLNFVCIRDACPTCKLWLCVHCLGCVPHPEP